MHPRCNWHKIETYGLGLGRIDGFHLRYNKTHQDLPWLSLPPTEGFQWYVPLGFIIFCLSRLLYSEERQEWQINNK